MKIFILVAQFLFIFLYLIKAFASGYTIDGCIRLIESKKYDSAIEESKMILRIDKWNPDAYSCLSMAYYLKGNRYYAFKKLKEAEEEIPTEMVERIHDIVWNYLPELVADKEFRDNYTMKGGACILRNLSSIDGNGTVLIGKYYNPDTGKTERHLRSYRCQDGDLDKCAGIDHVCPRCELKEQEAILIIKEFKIVETKKVDMKIDISRNIRYIRRILELQKGSGN